MDIGRGLILAILLIALYHTTCDVLEALNVRPYRVSLVYLMKELASGHEVRSVLDYSIHTLSELAAVRDV